MENKDKLYLEADMKLEKETKALREAASSVIELPKDKNKQPDLLYFSAIFVTTGENLNHAFFLPSELIKAEGTIINKALDVEHKEEDIIGHIYAREFMSSDGSRIGLEELASMETASLDKKEFHVVVAGIIYKNRFPNIAQEVADNKWKVSMEAYYMDYDVKVGDLILNRKEAESLGLASEIKTHLGKITKVIKKGKEIAEGTLTRVLRGIVFSGCGIVKNPANPPSVILETAKNVDKGEVDMSETIILDYDKLENKDINVTSSNIKDTKKEKSESMEYDDTTGICVNYKKQVIDATFSGPGTKIIHEDWCTRYDTGCTSSTRDTTDPNCLYVKECCESAKVFAKKLLKKKELSDKRAGLLDNLLSALTIANKTK